MPQNGGYIQKALRQGEFFQRSALRKCIELNKAKKIVKILGGIH
jgi:hypothetical protein